MKDPNILFYDIETSLQTVAVFQLYGNDFIKPENILTERHLVSICWKRLGEKRVHSISLLDDSKRFNANPHDDKYVAETFYKELLTADVLVAHNGDRFDLRYLKTRFLFHKLPALPPIQTIDTYKVAKNSFMLNSNSLNYLGKYLGLGGKKSTPAGLWLDVLRGDKQAIRTMVDYNKRDVTLLEGVFKHLQPYMPNHINRELFGNIGCPRCGSHKIQSRGVHRAITKIYQRFQCQSCSGWFRQLKAEKFSTAHRIL